MDHSGLAWKDGLGTPSTTPGQAANGDCGYRGTCGPLPVAVTLRNFPHGGPLRGTISEIDSDARLKMAVCQALLALSRGVE
jgi:hypothetical protein